MFHLSNTAIKIFIPYYSWLMLKSDGLLDTLMRSCNGKNPGRNASIKCAGVISVLEISPLSFRRPGRKHQGLYKYLN